MGSERRLFALKYPCAWAHPIPESWERWHLAGIFCFSLAQSCDGVKNWPDASPPGKEKKRGPWGHADLGFKYRLGGD